MIPEPCPPPSGALLTEAQSAVVQQLLAQMVKLKFNPSDIRPLQSGMVERLAAVCCSDEERQQMARELRAWIQWYRLPGYWLSFFFQIVTTQGKFLQHSAACELYSDAQVNLNDGLGVPSLENAYRLLTQRQAQGDDAPLLASEIARLRGKLKLSYDFYRSWCRTFDYSGCNPLTEHLYFYQTWGELCLQFPELDGSQISNQDETLTAIIAHCVTPELLRYRIIAQRMLGLSLSTRSQFEAAQAELQTALREAQAAHLDTEIGHLLRLCGYAFYQAGQWEEAARHFTWAYHFEAPAEFAYWQALSARELGDTRTKIAEGLPDDLERTEMRRKALGAYHAGRLMFEAHLGSQVLPIDRAVKQQMFRSYVANALQVAMALGSGADILAELETDSPHQATDVLAEIAAAEHLNPETVTDFRRAREIFHRHLNSLPDDFKAYLSALATDNPMRQRYMQSRVAISARVTRAQLGDEVAAQLLQTRLPGTVFLLFSLGAARSTAVLVDMSEATVACVPLPLTESDVRETHEQHTQALVGSDSSLDSGDVTQSALDALLAAYVRMLGPLLEAILPQIQGKHLKIFPRLQMNAVPLHAVAVAGKRLLDWCQVSYGQTLGLLLAIRPEHAAAQAGGLVMVHNDQTAPIYEGILKPLEQTYGSALRVLQNPPWPALLEELKTHPAGDVFFACHGDFYPNNPASSILRFGDTEGVTFSQIFGDLGLKGSRSVTLGACESGLARSEVAAEYIGLPGAFQGAGVRYFVGSLWKVNQFATAILLEDYFQRLRANPESLVGALNDAQRQLRAMSRREVQDWVTTHLPQVAADLVPGIALLDAQPYAHPDFWAGFYVSGDV